MRPWGGAGRVAKGPRAASLRPLLWTLYVVGLLRGGVFDWATALWESSPVFFKSYRLFEDEFKKVFDRSVQRGLVNFSR